MAAAGLLALVSGLLDVNAARYLSRKHTLRSKMLASERERLSQRKRPLLIGTPRHDDAANEYRRALALLGPLPNGSAQAVVLAARIGGQSEVRRALAATGDRCATARLAVLEGLQSDHRTWRPDQGGENQDLESQGALTLASCLILEGHQKRLLGDRAGALQSYVEAVSFSLDLETGASAGSAVALAAADLALHAVGRLVISVEGSSVFWEDVAEQVVRLREDLPGPTALQLDRTLLSAAAVEAASVRATRRARGVGTIFPWRLLAVYEVWQDDRLFHRMDRLMSVRDLGERRQLLRETVALAKGSTPPDLREFVISWLNMLASADNLEQLWEAVLLATKLEGWHASGRPYPEKPDGLQVASGRRGLLYERTSNGNGYRIWNRSTTDEVSARPLLERAASQQ